ncbi:Tfx family DNA-binding protein [Haloquadratum walsbyi]|uniref:Tfx family DNA-binding protein n=1 Tax=Haloquadratum walsbyi TaxID=293091 RepID=UPI0015F487CF|nr:Tfx family DNA-binding protein [Haloquadratum walsbyi]
MDSHSTAEETNTEELDVDAILAEIGFNPDVNVLTRRQAEVLTLRERGYQQSRIATALGTSRANVSSVESSARENVDKARNTVAFAEALTAPVQISIAAGTDLYDVPKKVYDACDAEGVKVTRTAPELMKAVADAAGDAVRGREVKQWLLVGVTSDGTIQVRRSGGREHNHLKMNTYHESDTTSS